MMFLFQFKTKRGKLFNSKINYSFLWLFWAFLLNAHFAFNQENLQFQKAGKLLEKARLSIGKNEDSVNFYTSEALKIGEKEKNILIQARSYAIQGENFQQLSQFKESIEYYLKSIELSEKNNEYQTLGSAYNGLGITYYYLNDLKKSNFYIQKSLEINLQQKNYINYSIISTNLSALYLYKGEYRKAISSLFKAEKELVKFHQEKYLPSLYNSLGGNYRMINELDSAEYFYLKSLALAIKYDVHDNIVTAFFNLGEMEMQQKHFDKAIPFLLKALKKNEQSKNTIFDLRINAALSESYEGLGDYKNAFYYKNKQLELNKTIFENEKQKAIEELQIKYETAQKERELQKQQKLVQESRLIVEKERNKSLLLLTLFLIVSITTIFVLKSRQSKQKMEQEIYICLKISFTRFERHSR